MKGTTMIMIQFIRHLHQCQVIPDWLTHIEARQKRDQKVRSMALIALQT
jgi:hypothetical protein